MKIKRLHFGPYAQDVNDGIGFLTILVRLVPVCYPISAIVFSTRTVLIIATRGFYFKLFVLPYLFSIAGFAGQYL